MRTDHHGLAGVLYKSYNVQFHMYSRFDNRIGKTHNTVVMNLVTHSQTTLSMWVIIKQASFPLIFCMNLDKLHDA